MLIYDTIVPADRLERLLALLTTTVAGMFAKGEPTEPSVLLDGDLLLCELFEKQAKQGKTEAELKAILGAAARVRSQ